MIRQLLMIGSALLAATTVAAHDGPHEAPGHVRAPHGGIIQDGGDFYIEVVQNSGQIKVYPLSHELKAIALSDISLSASVQFPRKKKESVTVTPKKDHVELFVDAKGAYRYALIVSVKYRGESHALTFQIEPQS